MAKKKIHIENTVRRLRFNNNEMTQQELADLVGISRQTVVAIRSTNTHHPWSWRSKLH